MAILITKSSDFGFGGDGRAGDGPSGRKLIALKPNPKAETLARTGIFRLARHRGRPAIRRCPHDASGRRRPRYIQALTVSNKHFGLGSWERVLPWAKDLTRRVIGQIWAQHTGNDESYGYGSRTREWQLNTVMLMDRVERPDADIAFRIWFTKGRERTPENRQDFEPTIWNGEARSKLPGMLARVDLPDGALRRCGGLLHHARQTPLLEFAVGPQALRRNGAGG